jgi:tripartite-type tricarboxylate transporter receptor subunit TctC
VVHPSLPANSIKEFIALARDKPGVLNYGSTGIGGPAHLGTELFKSMTGVNLVHVPYKGTASALTALIGGQVQVMFTDAGGVAPHVKAGKLRALAATSAEPSLLFPGLPTVAASGVPGYELVGITGIYAPVKTPVTIVNRLNRELVRVLSLADVKEKFLAAGGETVGNSPEQFAAVIKADIARKSKVIKDAAIKAE